MTKLVVFNQKWLVLLPVYPCPCSELELFLSSQMPVFCLLFKKESKCEDSEEAF
jgi:hypothetical protein